MDAHPQFDALVAEALAVDTDGWDFSWFEGRATEQRPSWGYALRAAAHLGTADASLDIETGGAEVYSFAMSRADRVPSRVAATEAWPPNLAIARRTLEPFGGTVDEVANEDALPFDDASFDVVLSRLPSITLWDEIHRVLRPGGTFLSQQVGHGTNRPLYEFLMGPQWVDPVPTADRLAAGAAEAGFELVDLQHESPRVEFFDIAAVIVFLRKVIWTVPDFSVERYRDRLLALHQHIVERGSFVSRGERALIEVRKG